MASTRLERLKNLVAKNPDGAFALYGLAMEYKSLKQFDHAAEVFDDLFGKHPDYIPGFLQHGSVLLELGLFDEAAEVLRRGIEVSAREGDQHARDELAAALSQLEST